ncbi:MAG: antibiotic biosynthesis monooxygenase [Bacteroidaceae bacterium]|nr:antibiotic biosynthesis monooxygenase [Bacteroidaceae bacterium]
MIRLNAFFTLKENVSVDEVVAITNELVAKSRQDEGNKGYDLYQSTTDPKVFMFCESWESQEALDKHSAAPHFTSAVPALGALTADGLKIERFED